MNCKYLSRCCGYAMGDKNCRNEDGYECKLAKFFSSSGGRIIWEQRKIRAEVDVPNPYEREQWELADIGLVERFKISVGRDGRNR